MPKTEGANQLIQLCCTQLLREFDTSCRQNGISYWLIHPDRFNDREAVVFWAVDNLDDDVTGKLCYEMSAVFPLGEMSFEDIMCLVPKNFAEILADIYGDIHTVPYDIATHYTHVDGLEIDDMKESLADLGIELDLRWRYWATFAID